jgi:hypothetical protein
LEPELRIPAHLASELHFIEVTATELKLLLCILDAAVSKAESLATEPTPEAMRVELSCAALKPVLKRNGPLDMYPVFEGVASKPLLLAGREERVGLHCDGRTLAATLPADLSYLAQDAVQNGPLIEFDTGRAMGLKSKHSLNALLRLLAWKIPKLKSPAGVEIHRLRVNTGVEMSISNLFDYMGSKVAFQDNAYALRLMRSIKADLAEFGLHMAFKFDRERGPRRVRITMLPPPPKRFGVTSLDKKSSTCREKAIYDPDLSQVLRDIAAGQITHEKAMQLLTLR